MSDDVDAGAQRQDPAEVAKFARDAARWWDPDGPAAPLHAMQPVRLDYLRDHAVAALGLDPTARRPLTGLRALDFGCGPGLLSEPLARMGADVLGVDASEPSIAAAREHASRQGLTIDYRAESLEAAISDPSLARFDLVAALEVVEHLPDPEATIETLARATRPGGLLVASTLNRTVQSWASAIVAAERVFGWLAPGTHSWRRFVRPSEFAGWLEAAGFDVVDRTGFRYDPIGRSWSRSDRDLSINYAIAAVRAGSPDA